MYEWMLTKLKAIKTYYVHRILQKKKTPIRSRYKISSQQTMYFVGNVRLLTRVMQISFVSLFEPEK